MVRGQGQDCAASFRHVVAGVFEAMIAVIIMWLCSGCAGVAAAPTAQPPTTGTSLTLSPVNASVLLGKTITVSAAVTNTTNVGVNWSVNNIPAGNATVGTIVPTAGGSAAATFTAPQVMPASATVNIEAASVADLTKTASATIDIASDVGIGISPASSAVELGALQTLQSSITSAGNPSTSVIWKATGAGCSGAACGTVNSAGVFIAPQILPSPPSVTVTATSIADPAKSAAASMNITSHFTLAISAAGSVTAGINAGTSVNLSATISPVSGSNPSTGILWSLSGTGCSGGACGTLASAVLNTAATYTAPAIAPSPAQVTIVATSVADPSKTAAIGVSINPVVSITISPTGATIAPGSTMNFAGMVNGTTNTGVTWDVNGITGGNSIVGSVTSAPGNTGQASYTAPVTIPTTNPVAIRARSVADSSATATASVTIGSPPVSIQVSPASAALSINHRETFQAAVLNSANTAAIWQVNNIPAGNATVGQICIAGSNPCQPATSGVNGSVDYLAPQAVPSPNPVTITAISQADVTKMASSAVTILPHDVVSVSPPSITLAPGASELFSAFIAGTVDQQATWNVAGAGCGGAGAPCGTIDATGLYVAPGGAPVPNTLSIVATSADDTSRSASAAVTITSQPAILSLLPSSAIAGAAGFSLQVAGANFAASSPGPGSVLVIGGTARSTVCQSAMACSLTLSAVDLAVAENLSVVVQDPGGASSSAVVFVVEPAIQSAGGITLTSASPAATGKDIVVVDLSSNGSTSPPAEANLSVSAIGIYQAGTGTCSLNGGPVELTRPASGTVTANICAFSASGLDPLYTYTLSGPSPSDAAIVATSSLGFGIVQLTIALPSTAATGARTLFIQNSNLDLASASGAVDIE